MWHEEEEEKTAFGENLMTSIMAKSQLRMNIFVQLTKTMNYKNQI